MGKTAPKVDPNVAKAALLSAQTGQASLDFFKKQSVITNKWAEEDRGRSQNTFVPMQNAYIEEAKAFKSPERINQRMDMASADVANQIKLAGDQRKRDAMSMGVNPDSGRYAGGAARESMGAALAGTGARNLARREVDAEGDSKMANALNMGAGLAVNPGQSMGLSNGAAGAGFSGAMGGYGQQASILQNDYNQRMQAHQNSQSGLGALAGGVGKLLGSGALKGLGGLAIFSSKDMKEDKRPMDGSLDAVNKMPVERWKYKDGIEDGGQHIGAYAEDFKAATGVGDGKSIQVVDAIGLTMGAVKELSAKVDALTKRGMGAGVAA